MAHHRFEQRQTGVASAAIVAAAVLLLLGCDSGSPNTERPTGGPTSETTPSREEMADARARTRVALPPVIEAMVPLGLQPRFGYGQYMICTDDAVGWEYSAHSRNDLAAGHMGSRQLAEQILSALESIGWRPIDRENWAQNGIMDLGDRWIVRAVRDDLEIAVNAYATEPYVLVQVFGPCLPTTPEQREAYAATGSEPIELDDT